MNDGERVDALLLAHLLGSVGGARHLSAGLTVLAAAFLLAGIGAKACVLAMLVIGLAALYLGLRVDLDARLFRALGGGEFGSEEMDASLGRLGLIAASGAAPRHPRTWGSRCVGARRLFIAHLLTVAAQCVVAALALIA